MRFPLRWLACAALALFTTAAVADGKAFTLPQKAKVEMADQRALISFDGKQETLVIDTQIKPVEAGAAAGKQSYAWVVPLPAVPTRVEAGTVGMFDTLRELTRPDVTSKGWKNDRMKTAPVILVLLLVWWAGWVAGLILWPKQLGWICAAWVAIFLTEYGLAMTGADTAAAILLGLTVLAAVVGLCFFCAIWKRVQAVALAWLLAGISFWGWVWADTPRCIIWIPPVAVYPKQATVGVYDTVILSGKEEAQLTDWLNANGYAMPADTAPMVAQLAKEGWCFVAMKLHEAPGGLAHPQPMGFVFPTTRAIYPMRLTGVGQVAPLTLDLFVCGEQEAMAEGFHAGCAVAAIPEGFSTNAYDDWSPHIRGADPVSWIQPGLRHWVPETKTLTWLQGTLLGEGMRQDITLGWKPLVPHRDDVYPKEFSWYFGVSAALLMLALTLILVAILIRWKRRYAWHGGMAGVAVAVAAFGVVYERMPVVERTYGDFNTGWEVYLDGKLRWRDGRDMHMAMTSLSDHLTQAVEAKLPPSQKVTADWIRSEIQKPTVLSANGKPDDWEGIPDYWRAFFIEGDSPNQFSIREENGAAKLYFYNGVGQEFQIWPVVEEKQMDDRF